MKIRFSSPLISTDDSAKLIKQFENLGFKEAHRKDKAGDQAITFITLKDEADHTITIAENERFSTLFTGIRFNVANFDEAVKEFTSMGYVNLQEGALDTGTSKATMLRSPEGLFVSVVEHIK